MIGAGIDLANSFRGKRADGLDVDAMPAMYKDDQIIHLLPSIDVAEQKRFREGTQAAELIDYFSRHFRT